MGITQGVEAGGFELVDARANLFLAKGVAAAEDVLVLTGAIDEHRLAVYQERPAIGVVGRGPVEDADAERCGDVIEYLPAIKHGNFGGVKIGRGRRPQPDIVQLG